MKKNKPPLDPAKLNAHIGAYQLGNTAGWYEAMKQWHGLVDRSNAMPCPRVVAGKRCRYVDCLCQYGGAVSNLLDHKAIWLNENREHVFTAEPYTSSLDLDLLEGFRAEARELGLSVRLSANSPWFPTSTILILVEKQK